jgi:predicted nucleic acid-binding protein
LSISKRHHYIPQFYLKGFTNNAGTFSIFDLRKGSLKNGLFFPKSHFFEYDRNTLDIDGVKTDFIEKGFQKLEDKTKSIFDELQKANGHIELDANRIFDLQLFVLCTYWRIPWTDGELNKILNSSNFNEYGFKLMNINTGEHCSNERVEELLQTNGFVESLRTVMPILQFTKTKDNEDLENWIVYYSGGQGVHITGDNPIVVRESTEKNLLSKELIMPLTKRQVLIRSKNKFITKTLDPVFAVKLDMLIFLQSTLYVCGQNAEYLTSISEFCKNTKQSAEEIKFALFQYLDQQI